jgi:hypothetical protein
LAGHLLYLSQIATILQGIVSGGVIGIGEIVGSVEDFVRHFKVLYIFLI